MHSRLVGERTLDSSGFRSDFASNRIPWTVIDQSVLSASNFLIGLVLARRLGIEEFGVFTLSMMVLWLFQSIQSSLVFLPMLSISPKISDEGRAAYCGTVVCHQIALAAAMALLLLFAAICAMFIGAFRADASVLAILALASLGSSFQDFMRRYFYATARPNLAAQNSIIGNGLKLIAIVAGVWLTKLGVPFVFAVIGATSALAGAISTLQLEPLAFNRSDLAATTERHWRIAKWQLATTIAFWASGNVFYFIAGIILGPASVGAMRAVALIFAPSHIVLLSVENHIPPTFSSIWRHESIESAWRHVIRFTLGSLVMIGSVSLVAASAPKFWLHILFGAKYLGFAWLSYFFVVHYIFTLLAFIGGATLTALEHARTLFIVQAITAILSVIASFPLIRFAGLPGAATGLVLSDVLPAVLTILSVVRHVRLRRSVPAHAPM